MMSDRFSVGNWAADMIVAAILESNRNNIDIIYCDVQIITRVPV